MVTQRSQSVKNLATSVYKVKLINWTMTSALLNTISYNINYASGGLALPCNDSYYKSILYQTST